MKKCIHIYGLANYTSKPCVVENTFIVRKTGGWKFFSEKKAERFFLVIFFLAT